MKYLYRIEYCNLEDGDIVWRTTELSADDDEQAKREMYMFYLGENVKERRLYKIGERVI